MNRQITGAALAIAMLSAPALAQTAPLSANDRLAQLGAEGHTLADRAGVWDASFTSWDAPGAAPVTVGRLVAEREMIGPMLQERLHLKAGALGPAWTRIDDLTFNRLEGRWDYISMDTRAAAGIMTAWSLGRDQATRVVVSFAPFALAVPGTTAVGQLTRMEEIITVVDADHETKDQWFYPADGEGKPWLAKRYSYIRRSK